MVATSSVFCCALCLALCLLRWSGCQAEETALAYSPQERLIVAGRELRAAEEGALKVATVLEVEGNMTYRATANTSTVLQMLRLYEDGNGTEWMEALGDRISLTWRVNQVLKLEDGFKLELESFTGEEFTAVCQPVANSDGMPAAWIGRFEMNITSANKKWGVSTVWVRQLAFRPAWYVSKSGGHLQSIVEDDGRVVFVGGTSSCCVVPYSDWSFGVYKMNESSMACDGGWIGKLANYSANENQWIDNTPYANDTDGNAGLDKVSSRNVANLESESPLLSCVDFPSSGDETPRMWGRMLPFSPGSAFINPKDGRKKVYQVDNLDFQYWQTYTSNETLIRSISGVVDEYFLEGENARQTYILANGTLLIGNVTYIRVLPIQTGLYSHLSLPGMESSTVSMNYSITYDAESDSVIQTLLLNHSGSNAEGIKLTIVEVDERSFSAKNAHADYSEDVIVGYRTNPVFTSSIVFDADSVISTAIENPSGIDGEAFEKRLDIPMGVLYYDARTGDNLWYWYNTSAGHQVFDKRLESTNMTDSFSIFEIRESNSYTQAMSADASMKPVQFNYSVVEFNQSVREWVEIDMTVGSRRKWAACLNFGLGTFEEVDAGDDPSAFNYTINAEGFGELTLMEPREEPVTYKIANITWGDERTITPFSFVPLLDRGSFLLMNGNESLHIQYNGSIYADNEYQMSEVTWLMEDGSTRTWVLVGEPNVVEDELQEPTVKEWAVDVAVLEQQYGDAAFTLKMPWSNYTDPFLDLQQARTQGWTRKLVVCAMETNRPLCRCETKPNGEVVVEGLVPKIWEAAAARMEIFEADFVYKCLPNFGAMRMALLESPYNDGELDGKNVSKTAFCHLSVGGVEFVPEGLQVGIRYSVPVYNSGYRVVIYKDEDTSGWWGFLRPFKWDLWLLIIVTPGIVGVALWLLERASGGNTDDDPDNSFVEMNWKANAFALGVNDLASTSLGAMIVALAFGFMVVVVIAAFTANTAAYLTQTQLRSTIAGIADIRGRTVATTVLDILPVLEQEFRPKSNDSVSDDNPDSLQDLLESRKYDALILPAAFASDLVKLKCGLTIVGDTWRQQPISIAANAAWYREPLPRGSNVLYSIAQAFDQVTTAIVELQQVNQLLSKAAQDLTELVEDECQVLNEGKEDTTSIGLQEMTGLWIILAAAVAVGILLSIMQRRWRKAKMMKKCKRNISRLGSVGKKAMHKDKQGCRYRFRTKSQRAMEKTNSANISASTNGSTTSKTLP